jgi:ABC-type phosphate/phosphonate transport system substrate-binding protein
MNVRGMLKAVLVFVVVIGLNGPCFAEIRIAVLALRGMEAAEKNWSPLGKYLTEQMGEKVVFVPTEFVEMMAFCKDNPMSFFIANPMFFIKAKVKFHAEPILTLHMKEGGSSFGGVLFSKKGSGIDSLGKVKGKTLMCTKFSSAGGWLYQKALLVANDVNPEHDCKSLSEGVTHDAVVYAVRDGKADIGAARTGILEQMAAEGKIQLDDVIVLSPMRHEGFSRLCSTPLYPEWPVAKLSKVKPEVAAALQSAMLAVPEGSPALKDSEVEKFVKPLDYGPVEEMMKLLKIEPFRKM